MWYMCPGGFAQVDRESAQLSRLEAVVVVSPKLLLLCSVCLHQWRVPQFALKYPRNPPPPGGETVACYEGSFQRWGAGPTHVRSGQVLPATTVRQPAIQCPTAGPSGRNTHTQRPREGASRYRSYLTRTGLELGDLGWQWHLCLIRIAPPPGGRALYSLVPVVQARSGPPTLDPPTHSPPLGWVPRRCPSAPLHTRMCRLCSISVFRRL